MSHLRLVSLGTGPLEPHVPGNDSLVALRADTVRRLTLCEGEILCADTPAERAKLEVLRAGLVYGVQLIDQELQYKSCHSPLMSP